MIKRRSVLAALVAAAAGSQLVPRVLAAADAADSSFRKFHWGFGIISAA